MTTFKSIIARRNGNGELQFICHSEERPVYFDSPDEFQIAVRKWEQSAQVFTAFNKTEELSIKQKAFITPTIGANFEFGVDVTKFVIIKNLGPEEGYFAFYKSPSKEDPDNKHPIRDALVALGKQTTCPTCGGEVKVHGTKDGTHYFEPVGEAQESYTWADMEKAYVLGSFGQRLSVDELLKRIKDMPFNMADLKKTYLNLTRLPEA